MTMKQASRYYFVKAIYICIDAGCVTLAIFLACYIRQEIIRFPVTFSNVFLSKTNPFLPIFVYWLVTVILFNNGNGLYRTFREQLESVEVWLVTKSVALSALVVIAVKYILKIEGFPRSVFIIIVVLMVVLFSLWRILKRMFVEYLVVHGYNNFNALIVGSGKVGRLLADEIQRHPGLGIKVVGFLDDDCDESGTQSGAKILGRIAEFPQIARREFINKLFITVHHDQHLFLNLLEQSRELGVAVRVVPQGFELLDGDLSKYNIGLIPILEYSDARNFRVLVGKRLFDFFVTLLLLIFLLPVFLIIAVSLKWDSQGPVFYLSRRYGRGGKIFSMLKFRSMRLDADEMLPKIRHHNEMDGPIFKIKKDPRITPVGQFLRRFSLDELPQLINVLKGEMSLVGPRPLPIEQIEKEDLRQLKRLEVRPGITGLWQIRGRSDISFSRLLRWDIWYINNWSFWLDVNILLQTVPVVVQGKGAY